MSNVMYPVDDASPTGRFSAGLYNKSNISKENNMLKKSVALTIMGHFMSGLRLVQSKVVQRNPASEMLDKSRPKTRSSKGKGRTSTKPSGAAALKRAATKRNNIRKHK